ncbi:MAG TPA: IPT/TIG domain-containing protein, partial [Candidatus Dormibacteraeota bacterium]|nr:IPT/TIG domain-containing protein [Candidatus Dormibacteraeota bacterium]
TIRAGDDTYNMNPCFGTNQTSRWGDYSGAAIDPQNPSNVWVSAEFAARGSAANGDAGCDWATFAAQLTFGVATAATLTSISPTSGPAAGGTSVTFNGTGFDVVAGTTTFSFGGPQATGVTCSSGTTCTGTSPAGTGTVTVTATVDGVQAGGSATFTYTGPAVPTLSSISPSSGPAVGGTSVTFNGAAFDPAPGATSFTFGGSAATAVSCSSSTQCTGTSPAGTGTVSVTATVDGAPANGSPTFTYIASLTSISPTSGPEGGGTSVTFTGTGFDTSAGRTTFAFGGVAATGVTCSSSTTCAGASPSGTGTVAVSGNVDGIPASGAVTFTYITPPGLSSMSPTSGPAAGGTSVTFIGRGFDVAPGQTSFLFGANAATGVSCSSSTSCTAKSPAGAGAVSVTATVDGATIAGNLVFLYVPSMTAVTPSTAPAGTTVTITGTGFDTTAGNTQFKFGNALATNVQCSSNTTCTAVVPAGNGNVTLTVTVDGQQGSNSLTFHYRKR